MAASTAKRLSWRQALEPWLLALVLLSATTGGVAPILLPLEVIRGGDPTHVGLVMATNGLGGLTAAIWGWLADRFRWHRGIFAGGSLAAAVALFAFPFASGLAEWMLLAAALGIGTAAASTVASLFVVEAHPQDEWETRLAWLQTFYDGGIVTGLLLTGTLTHLFTSLRVGFWTAAAITIGAVVWGWLATRTPPRPATPPKMPRVQAPQAETAPNSPHRVRHLLTLATLRQLRVVLASPFAILLVVWLVSNTGASVVYTLYPLLMQQVFAVAPSLASWTLAVANGLAIVLYPPAGILATRIGAPHTLQMGLGGRLVGLVTLTFLSAAAFAGRDWLAMLAFGVMALAWPFLTVSGSLLVSRLSPIGEGEGMGAYNAILALATLVGAVLAGFVARQAGYHAVFAVAAASLALALVLALPLHLARPAAPSRK